MQVDFAKYHCLGNDFIVIEAAHCRIGKPSIPDLTRAICDRRRGVGADGVLWLSASRTCDGTIDVYNADGGWAEKSGNGLRIAAVHAFLADRKRDHVFSMGGTDSQAKVSGRDGPDYLVTASLGQPDFKAARVPVKSKSDFVINQPIDFGPGKLPVTCLSIGNPHTVLVVENHDFDWPALGAEIETAGIFPRGTNVEFVRVANRKRLIVADWERGAGATGSSGTGAAAAVCAMVMLGLADRDCDVQFEAGTLHIVWEEPSGEITLTGPVTPIADGSFTYTA